MAQASFFLSSRFNRRSRPSSTKASQGCEQPFAWRMTSCKHLPEVGYIASPCQRPASPLRRGCAPRTLFTVNERPNGDLVFDLKPPPFGPDSQAVRRHTRLSGRVLGSSKPKYLGRQRDHATHLLQRPGAHGPLPLQSRPKAAHCFAPMFVRRYPDLRQPTPLSASSAGHVDLGDFKPSTSN